MAQLSDNNDVLHFGNTHFDSSDLQRSSYILMYLGYPSISSDRPGTGIGTPSDIINFNKWQ